MADQIIQLQPDSSGKKVDCSELTVGSNTVERQRVVLSDPTGAASLASVSAGGALKVDGSAATQPVSAPTLTKGTQSGNGFSVQPLKDAGRTYVVLYGQLLTGATTEALATFTKNVGGTATTSQTAYTITNGKTLVIQSASYLVKNTTTVANSGTINIRAAGSVANTSPILASLFVSAPQAVASAVAAGILTFGDGIMVVGDGTIQIGISHIENVTTASIVSLTVTGYEF